MRFPSKIAHLTALLAHLSVVGVATAASVAHDSIEEEWQLLSSSETKLLGATPPLRVEGLSKVEPDADVARRRLPNGGSRKYNENPSKPKPPASKPKPPASKPKPPSKPRPPSKPKPPSKPRPRGKPCAILPPPAPSSSLLPGELIDPSAQPKFAIDAVNALDPSFFWLKDHEIQGSGIRKNKYTVYACKSNQHITGLIDERFRRSRGLLGGGSCPRRLKTPIYGHTQGDGCFYPGKTFQARKDVRLKNDWENKLPKQPYLIKGRNNFPVVDTTIHWAYSLFMKMGDDDEDEPMPERSIEADGVPIIPHLHGGRTRFQFDGGPEFFFTPRDRILGPGWAKAGYDYVPTFEYDNQQNAAMLWYHDHTLGMTRLNVYAGLFGHYVLRDDKDTGRRNNPLSLPAFPYEAAYAINDKMFKVDGDLFYPAFEGDPAYFDFITDIVGKLPKERFPVDGGPTALAEFFGDVMLVNGRIWPRAKVERRNYRLRYVNGCDSRFLIVQFCKADPNDSNKPLNNCANPLPFTIIGSDQGLAFRGSTKAELTFKQVLMEPGARYDLILDFREVHYGDRVLMMNLGPDEPFGGDIPPSYTPREGPTYLFTDRIMAFDVELPFNNNINDNFKFNKLKAGFNPRVAGPVNNVRKVALFEGSDEFGRLQPLLGTLGSATLPDGTPVLWPNKQPYIDLGLAGQQMEGTMTWHEPTTELPLVGTTEIWEIWNLSGDAHPIHIHLVEFEILGRNAIIFDTFDSPNPEEAPVLTADNESNANYPTAATGTYLVEQPLVQHDGAVGEGFRVGNPTKGPPITKGSPYFENAPKDMVTALPGEVTRIKMEFPRSGHYVWHCHILSHEDHEMMREIVVCDNGSCA